jgi:hypothetical protein
MGQFKRKASAGSRKTHPCGNTSCGLEVAEGIRCDVCFKWFHNKCSELKDKAIPLYTLHPNLLVWVCNTCRKLAANCMSKAGSIGSPNKTVTQKKNSTNTSKRKPEASLRTREAGSVQDKQSSPTFSQVLMHKKANLPQIAMYNNGKLNTDQISSLEFCERLRPADLHVLEEKIDLLSNRIIALESLNARVVDMEKNSDLALGRYRNVLIHGLDEPDLKEVGPRKRYLWQEVCNVFRAAGVTVEHVRKFHRIGKWVGESNSRPIVVELKNPRVRDQLLQAADRVQMALGKHVQITPDRNSWVEDDCCMKDLGEQHPALLVEKVMLKKVNQFGETSGILMGSGEGSGDLDAAQECKGYPPDTAVTEFSTHSTSVEHLVQEPEGIVGSRDYSACVHHLQGQKFRWPVSEGILIVEEQCATAKSNERMSTTVGNCLAKTKTRSNSAPGIRATGKSGKPQEVPKSKVITRPSRIPRPVLESPSASKISGADEDAPCYHSNKSVAADTAGMERKNGLRPRVPPRALRQ